MVTERTRAEGRGGLAVFGTLFAVALVLHQLWWDGLEFVSWHFAVLVAAAWVIARPGSVGALVVLCTTEAVAVWLDMPGAGTHTLMAGVLAAAVVGWTGWTTLRARETPDAAALWEVVAPLARASLAVLYVAAALAKLNPQYFDLDVSCAAAMVPNVLWWDPTMLDARWIGLPAAVGSVAIEAALPVLLLVGRTRVVGLVLGVGFHVVLALAGNVPFSALVLALYVAFLPPAALARLAAAGSRARAAVASALLVGVTLAGLLVDTEPTARTSDVVAYGTRGVVVALGVLMVAALRAGRRAPRPPRLGLRLAHPVVALGAAVLVINAAAPYLGAKTESTFTMFSNLQTEGASWNHWLLPEAVQLVDAQDRLVTVTASSDPRLLARTTAGTRIVEAELERYLRRNPGTSATWTDGRRTWSATGRDADGARAVLDKVAKFRDVRAAGRRGC